jgi:hypothetical protein
MAQILSFAASRQPRGQDTVHQAAQRSMGAASPESEGIAEFERMMAHHVEMQRRIAEFNELCRQVMAEQPQGEVINFPARSRRAVG